MIGKFVRRTTPCLLVGALAAPSVALPMQLAEVHIGDRVVCRECSIVAQPVVTLGAPSDSVWPSSRSRIGTLSDGRYLLAPTFSPGRIAIYDETGGFAGSYGKQGSGPGEFEDISRFYVGPGDTIHVFESARYTRVAPSLEAVLSTHITVNPNFASFLSDGRLLVQRTLMAGRDLGAPIHIVSADGSIRSSIGPERGSIDPSHPYDRVRVLATSYGSAIWAGRVDSYHIDKWAPDGTHKMHIERDAPWFGPPVGRSRGPPETGIWSLWEDPDGLLWVAISVLDPDASKQARQGRDVPVRRRDQLLSELNDTVIEVLDLERGAVVARQRFDEAFPRFTHDGRVYSYAETPDGTPVIVVWSLSLNLN